MHVNDGLLIHHVHHKKRNKNKSRQVQEHDDTSSSDVQSDDDDDNLIRSVELVRTPKFNGRRLITSTTTDSPNNNYISNESYFKVMEQKYFMPILTVLDRLESMMKSLYKNQIKIEKALNKRQV